MTRVLALLVLLIAALPAAACLWDYDTLEAEAKGVPDTVRVVTGRFERNPALYYEMRLARVSKELRSTPEKLELYDDAGVACDRLHRGDEAVAWMEKKRLQMEKLRGTAEAGVLREHRYRYLANLGTFLAHRWLRDGTDRNDMSDIKRGRDLIAAAIELNPDAHFGREKYQLKAMEWIISPPKLKDGDVASDILGLGKHLDLSATKDTLTKLGYGDAVEGLSGLISLGDAWESIDIFSTLELALLFQQDSSIAQLAEFRSLELEKQGRRSLHPDAAQAVPMRQLTAMTSLKPRHPNSEEIERVFKHLRAEADQWHAQRTAYMVERMQAGRHPDVDETFWNDWQEPDPPSLYVATPQERQRKYFNIGAAVVGAIFLSLLIMRFARRRKHSA